MTMKIILNDEILKDEQLNNVKDGIAPLPVVLGEMVVQYAVGKIAETAMNEFTDKTIPYNAAPNFQLIEPDFMPKI